MTANSAPTLPGLDQTWTALANDGYVLTHEQEIGLAGFREGFLKTYFIDRVLRHDPGDWPVDRKRARDVVGYRWHDGQLHVREHETITITDRAGVPGKREHARIWLLDEPETARKATCMILATLRTSGGRPQSPSLDTS